jgi:hypothetical protein
LLNCQPDEVALVGPTSLALSFVAAGLNFRKGDNILIYHDDYPSNVYPWMALAERGVEVRLLNTRGLGVIRPVDVMGQVDENTRLVALASCHFISGYRLTRRHRKISARANILFLPRRHPDARRVSDDGGARGFSRRRRAQMAARPVRRGNLLYVRRDLQEN